LLLLPAHVDCAQEEEAEQMLACEEFVAEEERLRAVHEAQAAEEAAQVRRAWWDHGAGVARAAGGVLRRLAWPGPRLLCCAALACF
jgi:hypothetical protein